MEIIRVDCNYVQAEFASAYLLVNEGRGMFIEANTNHAIPFLKEAVKKAGLRPEDIDGLIITHIHLDHAGGAGLFLKEFPNAILFAHPKAARHAIDPSKLIASATTVYGEALMKKLYGTILPCPASRVVVLEDGDTVQFNGVEIYTKHTRGHANHHLVVIEPETKTLFSGDSFGVSYPSINEKRGLLMLASTSPTDFDGEAAIESIQWILKQDLTQIALTHFGFVKEPDFASASLQLTDYLQFSMELVKRIKKEELSVETVIEHIHDWVLQYHAQKKVNLDSDDLKVLALDLKVNAQGLVHASTRAQ